MDNLVRFVENDSHYEDSVKAMAAGILNHYFTTANGFVVAPEQYRNNNIPDFTILRIQRRFQGDQGVVDHTLAEAKRSRDSLQACLEQLENALEQAITEFGRCWAIMIHGPELMFYGYHRNRPEHIRLIPWGPAHQPQQNTFHARHDAMTIEMMLQHMVQNATPPAR